MPTSNQHSRALVKLLFIIAPLIAFAFSVNHFRAESAQCSTYVSPAGSDSGDGSPSSPFGTIQKGADGLAPGDTLCVHGGTYHQTVNVRTSGTNSNPITIMAYPGESVVIDGRSGVDCLNCGLPTGTLAMTDPVSGKGFNYNPLVGIEGDYVHFDGFTITRSMGRCVRIWRENGHVTGTILRNNQIRDCREGGIVFYNRPDHTLIENNNISLAVSYATYSRSAGSLDWSAGISTTTASNTTFIGNVIHENWGEGVIIGRDTTHTVFEGNILYDNYALQLYLHATEDVLVQRNLLYHTRNPEFFRGGNPSACIVITSAEPQFNTGDVTGIRVFNNMMTGCSNNIAFWGGEGQIRDVIVAHNTLVNAYDPLDPPVGIRVGYSNSGNMDDVLIANNIVLQDSGELIVEYGQSGVVYENNLWSRGDVPSRASSPGDVIGDPNLANPGATLSRGGVSADWYKITSASPAIASAVNGTGVTKDFFGASRDAQPDIGAHELLGGSPSPTFGDVPFNHPYHDEIEILYQGGYTAGCSQEPLLFCPEATMTRAESAVFVERGINGAGYTPSEPTTQIFSDLSLSSWAAKWATSLFNDGFSAGCISEPLQYCPWDEHTRTEGAVFFLRMLRGAAYVPPPAVGTFTDVPAEFWGAKWIEAAYEAGIVNPCADSPLKFCPDDPLTRGLAAWMMVQAKGLGAN
jgi:hypothetical protein